MYKNYLRTVAFEFQSFASLKIPNLCDVKIHPRQAKTGAHVSQQSHLTVSCCNTYLRRLGYQHFMFYLPVT
jgi:hypothetical protein